MFSFRDNHNRPERPAVMPWSFDECTQTPRVEWPRSAHSVARVPKSLRRDRVPRADTAARRSTIDERTPTWWDFGIQWFDWGCPERSKTGNGAKIINGWEKSAGKIIRKQQSRFQRFQKICITCTYQKQQNVSSKSQKHFRSCCYVWFEREKAN